MKSSGNTMGRNSSRGARVSRREILRWITATAVGGALLPATQGLAQALMNNGSAAPLVWIGPSDHLNVVTLQGQSSPRFLDLVTMEWDVRAFDPLHAVGYEPKLDALPKAPVLIVESVPEPSWLETPPGGKFQSLVSVAKAAILLGTDACYGGLHTPVADIEAFTALCKARRTPLIMLPGVPVPPHHVIGTLAHLEFFGFPALDMNRRPTLYYGEIVCKHCEHNRDRERGRFAAIFGEPGCLLELGCKGVFTRNSCSRNRWNMRESWCVGAGGPCTGCSEPGYPDHGGVGLYGRITGSRIGRRGGLTSHLESIGLGLLAVTAAGIVLRSALGLAQRVAGRESGR